MIILEAEDRTVLKQTVNSLRRAGKVPGIVYGKGKTPIKIVLPSKALTKESEKPGYFNRLINLKVDDKTIEVVAKDVQRDPVSDKLIHVDFLMVDKGSKIRLHMPIHFINEEKSPALKRGGVLNIVVHALEVLCSPYDVQEALEYDLTGLGITDIASLEKLKLPEGMLPVHPERDKVLATIVSATGMTDETEAKEGESGA